MSTRASSTSRWVRTALALALAGLLGMLSGGILLAVGGSASAEPCVPKDAWTETSDWVLESPGAGWYQVDQRQVVDKDAYDEVVGYTNWTWNPGNTEWDENDPLGPPWPHPRWSKNEGNHSGHPQPGDPAVNERGNYDRGEPGRSDWFHWEATVEHHDAVTHQEFRYAYDHAAVVCEPTPTEPTPTDPTTPTEPTPTDPTTPAEPEPTDPTTPAEPEPTDPEVLPGDDEAEDPEVVPAEDEPSSGKPAKGPDVAAAEVPTVVAAGQAGWSTTEVWGAALMGGGLALLLSSGTVLVSVRKD